MPGKSIDDIDDVIGTVISKEPDEPRQRHDEKSPEIAITIDEESGDITMIVTKITARLVTVIPVGRTGAMNDIFVNDVDVNDPRIDQIATVITMFNRRVDDYIKKLGDGFVYYTRKKSTSAIDDVGRYFSLKTDKDGFKRYFQIKIDEARKRLASRDLPAVDRDRAPGIDPCP